LKVITASLGCILALALSSAVQAEIYQSKDAEGQPVFTDSPSPGATKVDLPEENIADSVQPRPQTTATRPAAPAPAATAKESSVVVIPNSRNDRLEDELLERRRREVRDGEGRQELGDLDKDGGAASPHPATRPHPAARPHPGVHRR